MSSPFFRSPAFKAALKRTYASQPGGSTGPTLESAKKGAESAFDKAQKTAVEVLAAAQKAAGPTGDKIASRLSCAYPNSTVYQGRGGWGWVGRYGRVGRCRSSLSLLLPFALSLSFKPKLTSSSFVSVRLISALNEFVIYNAKLVGALAKQVYVAEKLAPPTSVGEIVGGWSTVWARGTSWEYWAHVKKAGEWKTLALYVSAAFFVLLYRCIYRREGGKVKERKGGRRERGWS